MKTSKYERRFYRDWTSARDLYSLRVVNKETDLQIFIDRMPDKEFIEEKLRLYRFDIENYITKDRRFLTSLKPLDVEINASPIVKEMSLQTKKANVGPMAAVAGAVAEFLGRALLKKGCHDVIIENGGDIFLKTSKIREIGIYAGELNPWNNLKLKIRPKDTPLGICSSSGLIGHSLSFGCADSVTILSKNTALADAVATATANRINSKQDLNVALGFARSIKGICGVLIVFRDNLASWGRVEL